MLRQCLRRLCTEARSPVVFKVSEPVPLLYPSLKNRWKPLEVVAPFELPEEAVASASDGDEVEDEDEDDDEQWHRSRRARRKAWKGRKDNVEEDPRTRRAALDDHCGDEQRNVIDDEVIEIDLDEEGGGGEETGDEEEEEDIDSADEAEYQEVARLVDEEDREEAEAEAALAARTTREQAPPEPSTRKDDLVLEQGPQEQCNLIDLQRSHRRGFKIDRLEQIVLELEQQGTELDSAAYGSLLQWCGNSKCLDLGTRVLAHIHKSKQSLDRYLLNMATGMYGKCGAVQQARQAFDRISRKNVFSWTIMITAYAQNGQSRQALDLLAAMDLDGEPPNAVTFVNALAACSALRSLHTGRIIHECLSDRRLDSNLIAQTALIDMYSKCSSLPDAARVFSAITNKDVVSYNAMISAMSRLGCGKESLLLFQRMDLEGIKPDEVTYGSVLNACERLGAVQYGAAIHRRIAGSRFESDVVVATALVGLYGRCGRVDSAREIFRAMEQRNVVSWTVMISSLAQNGRGDEALEMFRNMECSPDEMTLASALLACCHAGRVDEGWRIFHSMGRGYPVSASAEHYSYMVELLGRVGKLDDAERLIQGMPCEATGSIWMALLASCKRHGDLERGIRAASVAAQLDPGIFSAASAMLAELYAAAGRLDDASRLRKSVESRNAKREPGGRSWIEVKNRIHEFAVDELQHPEMKRIQEELQRLHSMVMESCEDERVMNQILCCCHSEKLAIGFGSSCMPDRQAIRVVKNIRICCDCHTFAKLASGVVHRQIVIRDLYGFHFFQNGICSCGV